MPSDFSNYALAEYELSEMGGINFMPLLTPLLEKLGFSKWYDDHVTMLTHDKINIQPFGYDPLPVDFQAEAVHHLKVNHPSVYKEWQGELEK